MKNLNKLNDKKNNESVIEKQNIQPLRVLNFNNISYKKVSLMKIYPKNQNQ